jgi:hypothetical protein
MRRVLLVKPDAGCVAASEPANFGYLAPSVDGKADLTNELLESGWLTIGYRDDLVWAPGSDRVSGYERHGRLFSTTTRTPPAFRPHPYR